MVCRNSHGTTGRGLPRDKSQSIVPSADVSGTGRMSNEGDLRSSSSSGSLSCAVAMAVMSIAVPASAEI
ncbi:unnamed protein product, partial [Dicrocoelium dendriticum]